MNQETIVIHRGRNKKTSGEFLKVSTKDYNFDFRGFDGGSRLNPLWLLLKAWITSKEIPEAKKYLIDGGMLFWVGFFLKRRYPSSKLYLFVPEPAFYLDPRKGFFQKLFFNFKISSIAKSASLVLAISPMVAEDARKLLGNEVSIEVIKFPIPELNFSLNQQSNDLLFVAERPSETGYVKGLEEAFQIHRELRDKSPEIKLYLAGKETEALTCNKDNIIGLGQVEIIEAFRKAKVLIAPAKYDAFPMIVPEAISAGLIPIVSECVGTKYFLRSVPSLTCKKGNIELWCRTINEILNLDDNTFKNTLAKLKKDIKTYKESKELLEIREYFQG